MQAMQQLEDAKEQIVSLQQEVGKIIVGQKQVIEQLVWCIVAGGHALLEGIPGLGKTMLVRTLSDVLSLQFSRIQFTPDLMPADITGTTLIDFGSQGITSQRFGKGPIFGNLILADEINRATPKTQSALLEAMQEGTVTAGGETYQLPKPFFVLATQNPIEQEGTYPLPEAQLDRFLLKIGIEYPSRDELKEIVKRTTGVHQPTVEKVMSLETLAKLQQLAKEIVVADDMLELAVQLVLCTHRHEEQATSEVKQYVRYGAGPRALQSLISVSKVRALGQGRAHVSWNDMKDVALPVLRHRIGLSYEAEAHGITTDHIVAGIIHSIQSSRGI